jgi:dihydrofolate reductase/thymidylate synthase
MANPAAAAPEAPPTAAAGGDDFPSSSIPSQIPLSFSVVVAATQSGGIGCSGTLPWAARSLPSDLKRFRSLTATAAKGKINAVLMGRKTWESLPAAVKPLPGRINLILSRSNQKKLEAEIAAGPGACAHTYVVSGLSAALHFLQYSPLVSSLVESIFVIGGSGLYAESLSSPLCRCVHLTRVLREFPCDTFIEPLNCAPSGDWTMEPPGEVQVDAESKIPFQFQTMQRRVKLAPPPQLADKAESGNAEEQQYLDLVRRVLTEGVQKGDRTGTGTLSVFGAQLRFSLRDGRFPLLTSKRVFWRGVAEELIWLIKGATDAKQLAEKNVHIWDENGSRQFLDKLGFKEREVGDLGPVRTSETQKGEAGEGTSG